MAYRTLESDDSVQDGVRRIANEQIGGALDEPDDEALDLVIVCPPLRFFSTVGSVVVADKQAGGVWQRKDHLDRLPWRRSRASEKVRS